MPPPPARRAVVNLTVDAPGSCREVPIDLTAISSDSDSDFEDLEDYIIGNDYTYGGRSVQQPKEKEQSAENEVAKKEDEDDSNATISVPDKQGERSENENEIQDEIEIEIENENENEEDHDSDATISLHEEEIENEIEVHGVNEIEAEEAEYDSDATISLHEDEDPEGENMAMPSPMMRIMGSGQRDMMAGSILGTDHGDDEEDEDDGDCAEFDGEFEEMTESEYYRERNEALDSDYEPSETIDGEEEEEEEEVQIVEAEKTQGVQQQQKNNNKKTHQSAAKRVDVDLTIPSPSRSATLTSEQEREQRQKRRHDRVQAQIAAQLSVATPPPTPPVKSKRQQQPQQPQHQPQQQSQPQQEEELTQDYATLPSYTVPSTGLIITPGAILDLETPLVFGTYRAHIFRVTAIRAYHPDEDEDEDAAEGRISLAGLAYARAREMKALIPKKLNEVCLIAECGTRGDNNTRDWRAQAVMEIDPAEAARVRPSGLRTTNAPYPTEVMRESPFPSFRFDMQQLKALGAEAVERDGVLVCRYAYVRWYDDDAKDKRRKMEGGKAAEYMLCCMEEGDADPEFRVSDTVKRNFWRGGKVNGGSHIPGVKRPDMIVLDDDDKNDEEDGETTLRPGQTYTAGDIFCGCGGASRGMSLAGVKISFAVDNWPVAVRSYAENFPDTTVHQVGVFEFLTSGEHQSREATRVDLLHLSPPCQAYSPAHTRPGVHDEANEAALFSCGGLVERCRPRLFTIEQTFGIVTFDRYRYFLNSLVASFVRLGYSARWSVVHLSTWGLPQMRRRLIMIGAGPGEKLPPFPSPTHSAFPARDGLLPLVSPLQTLRAAGVPLADRDRRGRPVNLGPMHDPATYKPLANPKKKPWDPNQLLKTVTCGGSNWHWSGTRDLTPLEYAVLQGFPPTHRFVGKRALAKHQIGNAFPPSIVRRLYEHLVAWLDSQDGLDLAVRRRSGIAGGEERERAKKGPVVRVPSVAGPSTFGGARAGMKRKRGAAAVTAAVTAAVASRRVEQQGFLEMEVLEEVEEGDEAGMAERRRRKGKGRAVDVEEEKEKEVIVVEDDDEEEEDEEDDNEVVLVKSVSKRRRVGGGGGGRSSSSKDQVERIEDCIVVATDW